MTMQQAQARLAIARDNLRRAEAAMREAGDAVIAAQAAVEAAAAKPRPDGWTPDGGFPLRKREASHA